MALTIKYTVTRSDDYKSISVVDDGTEWGVGGEPDTGDVTSASLVLYGYSDSETALKSVLFTSGELSTFLSGGTVTLLASDSRLFETTYFPDNFYTTSLNVSVITGETVSTLEVYDSTFYVRKAVYGQVSSVILPITKLYEANKQVTGNLAAIYMLDELENGLNIARKDKWVKIYEFLKWNFALD